MDEIYANVEYVKSQVSIRPSTPAPGPSSPRSRPHVAVAVSLGLLSVLLLAGLVCLGVHDAELFSIKANLAERLRISGDKLSSVSAERDQLKDNFTAQMHVSGDKLSSVSAERDQLKDKVTALTQEKDGLQLLLKQKKTCPEGWTMFRCSCYLLSTRDDSWENGRKDCTDQRADLVIIDSLEEQTQVERFLIYILSLCELMLHIGPWRAKRESSERWMIYMPTLNTTNLWTPHRGPIRQVPAAQGADLMWLLLSLWGCSVSSCWLDSSVSVSTCMSVETSCPQCLQRETS
uniref:C-type lectin domain family 12 member B-like isoform X2 n=1 Tax=Gasterosteus aculeatus aculeatus TaxID=481459 RepID=UPI001A9829CC|nr:C-type lectin domain family 12 member B-like isoform X2 [Gasterosteus aculeatus aculeatus]